MKAKTAPVLARWKVDDLKAHESNPRTISKKRFERLKLSIENDPDFFEVRPIIVNVNPTRRGIVIGGHMRLLAARELGWPDVPCVEVNASAKQEKAWLVQDNVHHGEFDREKLAEMVLPDVGAFEHALPSDQMDSLIDEFGEGEQPAGSEEDQADTIAAAKEHITQPGDVWEMGDHRLICGDSTVPETFAKLLDDGKEKAQMCFTDPPYNVDYGETTKNNVRGAKHKKIANDKMGANEWAAFTRAYMRQIHANVVGAAYVAMSTKEWPSVMTAFLEAGFHWSDTILWIKDSFTLGRSDYQRQYEPIMVGKAGKPKNKLVTAEVEPILYGWPAGVDHKWNGGRDQGDAWFFKRPRKNPVHPTQKPVELVKRAIDNSSDRGDIVLDCFAGGGQHAYRVRTHRAAGAARRARRRLLRRNHWPIRRPHGRRQAQAQRGGCTMDWPGHHDRRRP